MFFKRELHKNLQRLANQYPVTVVTGPRQSGKTTLVKTAFPKKKYINLESPENRRFAVEDPIEFLKAYKGGIIDEFQRAPALTSYIQDITDKDGKDGLYILTGSQQFEMMSKVSQSLAGRVALLKLLPLSLLEFREHRSVSDINELIYAGLYPGLHQKGLNPVETYSFYFQTYIERDLRQMLNVHDLGLFERFVKLCAFRNGQILNLSGLGNDCGISQKTAGKWVSILEESYIIYLLRPHFNNLGKRLIKSPKLYFLDTGLACFLSDIHNASILDFHSMKGPLLESLVLSEILKMRHNAVLPPNVYYWRDNTGHEIDFILDVKARQIPVEVKSGKTLNSEFFKNLKFYQALNKNSAASFLIYGGNLSYVEKGIHIVNLDSLDDLLQKLH